MRVPADGTNGIPFGFRSLHTVMGDDVASIVNALVSEDVMPERDVHELIRGRSAAQIASIAGS